MIQVKFNYLDSDQKCIIEITDMADKYVHTDPKTGKLIFSSSIKKKLIEKVSKQVTPVSGRGMIICPPGKHFCRKCGEITKERNSELLCSACKRKYKVSEYSEIKYEVSKKTKTATKKARS